MSINASLSLSLKHDKSASKIVLVTGFFDLLHSGHIRFLEKASSYGKVIVSLGSDLNLIKSKGKTAICSEEERKYMLSSLKFVDSVHISHLEGPLSFETHLKRFKPDYFIINGDGDSQEKKECCVKNKVKYIVLKRDPKSNFTPRSSTKIRNVDLIPHRLDISGGFFDQVKLNSKQPGSVITCNVETLNCADRAGMSSSTRRVIHQLFGNRFPPNHSEQNLANIILAYENFNKEYISGATDAYGLVFSSVCKFKFDNGYTPYGIEKITNDKTLNWLEKHLFLKFTQPRPEGYKVYTGKEKFPIQALKKYSQISEDTWQAIKSRDLQLLIKSVNSTCSIQEQLVDGYISEETKPEIEDLKNKGYGAKLMGAGGHGYIMCVGATKPENATTIKIRKESLSL